MTRNETLQRKLADWQPHSSRQTLAVGADAWNAQVVADRVESLGVELWEVRLTRTTAVTAPLAEQVTTLAGRITGLMEPVRVVEIDATRAQLRSTAPAAQGEALFYYEILRDADGTTHVARYQASLASGKRQQIPFTLTREALAKLLADLTA